MRRIPLLLSVAATPLLIASMPAYAQQGTSQTSEDDTEEDATTASGNQIVVSGIRQSLETSQAIKRESDSILDAIVAEDIGKLPDDTAAESIARIAGVQVTRFSDEANGILIRGLPDVATSYNGREIFTAELRRVQLQDFPAQALAGIEVYKSGTADIIEPGLAGLVNVRTRRPFDFKDMVIAGGVRGTYNDQSKKYDPSGNVLFSDRWDMGSEGEMGFLANVTYAQSQYYNGVRYNSSWIRDSYWSDIGMQGTNVRNTPEVGMFYFPNNIGLYNDGGKRYRPSGNFSLQYSPNPDLEMYIEGIYQGYRGRGYADNFDVPLEGWGPNSTPPVFSDVVLYEGTDQAASLVKSSGAAPQGYRSTAQDYTNTYQVASGAKWQTGMATLSTDFAYTWSRYHRESYSLDFRTVGVETVNATFDDGGAVYFDLGDWDPLDPNNYIYRGYYESLYDVSGKGWQWRVDLDLETDWDLFPKLEFGFRATDRNGKLNQNDSRYADVSVAEIPYASLPIGELVPTIDPFRGYNGFSQYLTTPRSGIYGNREDLREFTYNTLLDLVAGYPDNGISQGDYNYFNDQIPYYESADIVPGPTSNWKTREKTYAAYAQGKYRFDLGSLAIDGVLGLRAVITNSSASGVSTICYRDNPEDDEDGSCTIQYTPRNEKRDYLDLLPNASMRIKLTDNLQLRLGYTKTRTKANFGDLIPALNIRPVVYNDGNPRQPGLFNPDYTGNAGNPNLNPFTSKNYDASLEWYFSKTGFLSGAVFYRDIYGFTTYVPLDSTDPELGRLRVVRPINAADATIKGAEVNFQTFFDFLPAPWDGFGVSANATYLTGKNRVPNPGSYDPETNTFGDAGEYQKILGLSKWTYNLAAFYEKGGFSTRISYNRRSDWVNGYGFDEVQGNFTGNGTMARDRLDASMSYDITKNFTISADVSNILANPFRNYVSYQLGRTYPIDLREEGRYYGLGVRFRFGE